MWFSPSRSEGDIEDRYQCPVYCTYLYDCLIYYKPQLSPCVFHTSTTAEHVVVMTGQQKAIEGTVTEQFPIAGFFLNMIRPD